MKFISKVLLTFALINSIYTNAQEPVRNESNDSIVTVLQKSTNGLRYLLSDTGINSELSEVGTTFFMGKYIILSNKKRRHYKTTYNENTKTFNNNLYCVNIDKNGDLSFPLLFSSAIDSDGNEGSISFSPNQKTIFYTHESKDNPEIFELYKAELNVDTDEKWTNVQKVDVIPAGYSVETPSVSADGKRLFFASNMPGTLGGLDIFEATINEDGSISNVKNLGPNVNTTKDEKHPILTEDNKHLYFSSKGHLNLGGYDVFRSSVVKNEYLEALNLGTTLNSRKDDIAFVLLENSKGYISTEKGTEGEGNFDVLKFEIRKLENRLDKFIIIEKKSLTVLPNARVILKDEFGAIISESLTDSEGKVTIDIKPVSYNFMTVTKPGYEPFEARFNSENIIDSKIALTQTKAIVTEEAIVIENIFFEFNKAEIKKESQLSLNKVIDVINEKPTLKLAIEAHTDNKGSEKYNQALSEKRAKSAYQYFINNGISAERLSFKGYGESKPLHDCGEKCTEIQDQENRRVEFNIVK